MAISIIDRVKCGIFPVNFILGRTRCCEYDFPWSKSHTKMFFRNSETESMITDAAIMEKDRWEVTKNTEVLSQVSSCHVRRKKVFDDVLVAVISVNIELSLCEVG